MGGMVPPSVLLDCRARSNNLAMDSSRLMTMNSFSAYLQEIGRYPLLEPKEEIELSRQILEYVRLHGSGKKLTLDEKRLYRAGLRARERLVNANLRLVVHISHRYVRHIKSAGIDQMDLIQEGSVGLQRAAEKFDGTKGYKFSTYAYWWIRQAMTRMLESNDRAVRIPSHKMQLLMKIHRTNDEYVRECGAYPSLEYLSEKFEVPIAELRMLLQRSVPHTSLDVSVQDTDSPLLDLISQTTDMYEEVDALHRYSDLQTAIQLLEPDERQLLEQHYGLTDGEQQTLHALAKKYGCSREAVRQKRNRILLKMTRKMRYHRRPSLPAR